MAVKPLSKLFIDTSGFIALFDKNDTSHQEASGFYVSLSKAKRLFTTLLVVSETYTWFRYHVGYSAGCSFLDLDLAPDAIINLYDLVYVARHLQPK